MFSAIRWHCYHLSAVAAAPSSLDCGQLLTICDIVWRFSQGHMSVAARPHFLQQDVQWPCWSGSDSAVPSSIWVGEILVAR